MIVIPPLAITDARLTSTTVIEVAPAAYAGGTTYADGATVSVAGAAGLIAVYESLQNSNTGHTPASSPTWWLHVCNTYQAYSGAATYALGDYAQDNTTHLVYQSLAAGNTGNALTDTTKWQEIGPTNARAMFDTLRSTRTVSTSGTMTIVITPGTRVDALALLGLVANSATITTTSGATTVYTATVDLDTRVVLDWYDYFFQPFSTAPSLALFDLPPFTNAVITATLTKTSGDVECGALVIGLQEYIGAVQYDAESDVLNFSSVERDFDGQVNTMIQRRNVPKTVQSIWLGKSRVNRVRDLRDALNGTPAVWSGLDDSAHEYFEALLILGFYRRFSINLAKPETAILSLELEEI